MDVAVTDLRANLSHWLDRVKDGDEVVITDRGTPVARILALDTASTLERLIADGVVARPAASGRPTAAGRRKPRPKRSVAGLVSEQRR
jgi:prevent-host-death family protein